VRVCGGYALSASLRLTLEPVPSFIIRAVAKKRISTATGRERNPSYRLKAGNTLATARSTDLAHRRVVQEEPSSKELLRAGELARLTGVSADTLRHYERKGLLKPRRAPNGYREYSPHAIERVRLIRSALAIGLKLDELAHILKTREAGGAPCH